MRKNYYFFSKEENYISEIIYYSFDYHSHMRSIDKVRKDSGVKNNLLVSQIQV